MSQNKKSVIFFGSFLHYSTKIAQAIKDSPRLDLIGVVSTPPMPAGKKKELKKTHTHLWAEENNIPVFTPENLFETSPENTFKSHINPGIEEEQSNGKIPELNNQTVSEFFVVAGYGKLLPKEWLDYPKISSINLHFSLLPDYKGANPAEWAIMLGETETGVSMITMSEEFDHGAIITRKPYPLAEDATRETIYEPLYDLAAEVTRETLPTLGSIDFATPQEESDKPYAKRFIRAHGFIDWQFISAAIEGKYPENPLALLSTNLKEIWQYLINNPSETNGIITPEIFTERSIRALSGFPGVWTYIPTKDGKKRMKLLSSHIQDGKFYLDNVQIEGKTPSTFNQIKNQISD